MTQQYTEEDIRLRESAVIRIINALGETDIALQFPPRITSDGKKAQWEEKHIAAYEPLAYWKGSSARHISVDVEYVVDGGVWTPAHVMQQLRSIKSYFYITLQQGMSSYPIIELDLYEIVPTIGGKLSTWRADDVSITYDGPLVTQGDITCNLKSKATLSMNLFTVIDNISDPSSEGKTDANGLVKLSFGDAAANVGDVLKNGFNPNLNKWF